MEPTRELVEDQVDRARGEMSRDEFQARSRQYRTVDMAKGGRAFLPYRHLGEWLNQSAEQISATPWGSLDHDQFADAVAAAFANVNYAHGFREGDGRIDFAEYLRRVDG